jgi:hypothetical protein
MAASNNRWHTCHGQVRRPKSVGRSCEQKARHACHPRTGLGSGTNHRADHPAPLSQRTGPVSHKPHQRRRRIPCCCRGHPTRHAHRLGGSPLHAPLATCSASSGKPCTMAQATCGHVSFARSAQIAWTAWLSRRTHSLDTQLRPVWTPYLPSSICAQRQADTTMPAFSAARASQPWSGLTHPPFRIAGAREQGGRDQLPPPAWPLRAAPKCPHHPVRLRGCPAVSDTGMQCPALAAQVRLCHDILKVVGAALCTGQALPLPSSHPSAASLVSPPALAPPQTALQPALRTF